MSRLELFLRWWLLFGWAVLRQIVATDRVDVDAVKYWAGTYRRYCWLHAGDPARREYWAATHIR